MPEYAASMVTILNSEVRASAIFLLLIENSKVVYDLEVTSNVINFVPSFVKVGVSSKLEYGEHRARWLKSC
jgi:hypothetical protein